MDHTSANCPRCGSGWGTGPSGTICQKCGLTQAAGAATIEPGRSTGAVTVQAPLETVATTLYPAEPRPFEPAVAIESPRGFGPRLLSQYQLMRHIGAGNMGTVYLARHRSLDRLAAIKFLHGMDDNSKARFAQEGKLLARLSHPHVIGVFDAGEDDGVCYLACEFVEGESLRDLMDRMGPLPIPEVLKMMPQLLDGLSHAHQHGIVHRDLKPANVLITRDGKLKIADFGLAGEQATGGHSLTRTGMLMGSPSYMSPEQCRGEKCSSLTDIYAVGVMLYEMFTGRPPFEAQTLPELLVKHMNDPIPDPAGLCPELSGELSRIVTKAMSKKPESRFASASELAEILGKEGRRITSRSRIPTQVAREALALEATAFRNRMLKYVGMALLLLGGMAMGIAGSRLSSREEPPPPSPSPSNVWNLGGPWPKVRNIPPVPGIVREKVKERILERR